MTIGAAASARSGLPVYRASASVAVIAVTGYRSSTPIIFWTGEAPLLELRWRTQRSKVPSHSEPAVPAYSSLRMPWKHPQVLGLDLNRSERAGYAERLRPRPT